MLLFRRVRGIAALAGALVWAFLPPGSAYTTMGHCLGMSDRDVRVFNNGQDPTANDYIQDPFDEGADLFPGADGTELAVWKAALEWGSGPHGKGTGDPTQDVLGDGGARFDFLWMGSAPAVGGANGNTVSFTDAGAPGTLGLTWSGFNGWKIQLNDNDWDWEDGPGCASASFADIQAVVTHELGHALGLGHSTDSTATMSTVYLSSCQTRSIETDDASGIQSIYGAKQDGDPRVDKLLNIEGSDRLALRSGQDDIMFAGEHELGSDAQIGLSDLIWPFDGMLDNVALGGLNEDGDWTELARWDFEDTSANPDWHADKDPLMVDFQGEGHQWMGYSVAGAGDLDLDGHPDIVVGASKDDGAGTNWGGVYTVNGAGEALWKSYGSQGAANYGRAVASAGDINGDGGLAIAVGSEWFDLQGKADAGKVILYDRLGAEEWDVAGEYAGDRFGAAVAGVGDVDGDGHDDIAVGASFHDDSTSLTDTGKVYVFSGQGTLLWRLDLRSVLPGGDDDPDGGDKFGTDIAAVGDVDGDQLPDFVVGAPFHDDKGTVFLLKGIDGTVVWDEDGEDDGDEFGHAVAGGHDVTGDGIPDIVVGSYRNGNGASGNDSGRVVALDGIDGSEIWESFGFQKNSWFGYSVAMVGDLNDDGLSDVLVGTPLQDDLQMNNNGAVYLLHGAVGGMFASWTGEKSDERFGWDVADPGDVNMDGSPDLLVGAYAYEDDAGSKGGRAVVIHGRLAPVMRTDGQVSVHAVGGQQAPAGPDLGQYALDFDNNQSTPQAFGRVLENEDPLSGGVFEYPVGITVACHFKPMSVPDVAASDGVAMLVGSHDFQDPNNDDDDLHRFSLGYLRMDFGLGLEEGVGFRAFTESGEQVSAWAGIGPNNTLVGSWHYVQAQLDRGTISIALDDVPLAWNMLPALPGDMIQLEGAGLVPSLPGFDPIYLTNDSGSSDPATAAHAWYMSDGSAVAFEVPANAASGDVWAVDLSIGDLCNSSGVTSNPWPIRIGEGEPDPILTAITPSTVAVVGNPQPTLVVSGTGLDAITSVSVGGVTTTDVEVSPGVLQFELPHGIAIGGAVVQAFTAGGKASNPLSIVATSPSSPVLLVETSVIGQSTQGENVKYFVGADQPFPTGVGNLLGDIPFIVWSFSLSHDLVQFFPDLPLDVGCVINCSTGPGGAQLPPLQLYPPPLGLDLGAFTGANGVAPLELTTPFGMSGTTLYAQFWSLRIAAGPQLVFPTPVSNWIQIDVQ